MGGPAVPGWHALLGPLPEDAEPRMSPVGAVADWSSLTLELSAGAGGLRILQVLLDGAGRPLSASDHVLFRYPPAEAGGRPWMRQDNIGGRFETDGSFQGTCWRVEGPEPAEDEAPRWAATPRSPAAAEIAALEQLVTELIGRQTGRKPDPPS